MADSKLLPWIDSIRHFIGTGDDYFLSRAIDLCADTATKAFLVMVARTDERKGYMPPPDEFQSVANQLLTSLAAESRTSEAALIELLVRRSTVRLATLNVHARTALPEAAQSAINFAFNRGLQLAETFEYPECEAYFARTLGDYEQSLGNWAAARGAHGRSVRIYADLVKRVLDVEVHNPAVTTAYLCVATEAMLAAAISSAKVGDEETALQLLKNTFISYEALIDIAGAQRQVALGIQSGFEELARTRQLRAASAMGDLALQAFKDLHAAEPGSQQGWDLAVCALQVGQFLAQIGDVPRSVAHCTEGVRLLEALNEEHPWFYRGALGLGYGALANAYRHARKLAEAFQCFEQSVRWLRLATAEQDDPTRVEYLPRLIEALNNLGSAFQDSGDPESASHAYEEACTLIEEFRAKAPSMVSQEWLIYANLCVLVGSQGRPDEARALGERAMNILESGTVPDHEIWIERGLAEGLYTFMLEQYARAGDAARAFGCLLALRTDGRTLKGDPAQALRDSLQRVEAISHEQATPLSVLCPQTLRTGEVMIAVLRSDAETIEFIDCGAFTAPARALLQRVNRMMEENGDGNCDTEAEHAWSALPVAIQNLLAPTDGGQTLICGDDIWTSFPWEALKFGPSFLDALGLHHLLPRWHSPDASTLALITAETIDVGASHAAVISPWNATDNVLEIARRESIAVAEILGSQPPVLGEVATRGAMEAILANAPGIIHYSGHGAVSDGEEVLILHGPDQPALVGSREVRLSLRSTPTRDSEPRGRLVILNCCYAGGVRSFGGHREDLASTFLKSGISSVVASATPVFDTAAGILGVCLHHRFVNESEPLAMVVVRARRLTARWMVSLAQPNSLTWCTTVYHGNPFVTYRRRKLRREDDGNDPGLTIASILIGVLAADSGGQSRFMRDIEEVLTSELDSIR